MCILGIDQITYGTSTLEKSRRFFLDWGLKLVNETEDQLTFESLNGCRIRVADPERVDLPVAIEEGPTVREVMWGVQSEADLNHYVQELKDAPGFADTTVNGIRRVRAVDPNGLAICLQVTQKKDVYIECAASNTWAEHNRINKPSPIYERAEPIEVGHVVFFVEDLKAVESFYIEKLGFVASDRYPNRGSFLRCTANGGHHDLFLLQTPQGKKGINHVAFTVRDIHEVFGGGLHFSRCGWDTQLGPGRHPVSSAYFWYFNNPAGGLVEYYADEDQLTAEWESREFEPGPTVFAEWAIEGGIDGDTRRQKSAKVPEGKFLTDRK